MAMVNSRRPCGERANLATRFMIGMSLCYPGPALERALLEPEVLDRLDADHVHLRLLELARVVPVHRLPARELVEHPDARLARAVAGLAVAAEGQVRLGARRRVVDGDHAGRDALAEAQRVQRVGRVDRRREAVAVVVGERHRLVEAREARDGDDRAERLRGGEVVLAGDAADDRRVVEEPGLRIADEALAWLVASDPPR